MRGLRQQPKRRLKSEFVFFFFSLHHDYSNSLTLSNVGELSVSSVAEFLHCKNAIQVRLGVYLGVKTCEVFLCFQASIFPGSIALSSQWLLCIHRFTSLVSFTGFYTTRVSLGRERKFRRGLFTSSMKRKIRNFHVVVVQYKKGVADVQCCCFALLF